METGLFVPQIIHNKWNIEAPQFGPFVRGIWWFHVTKAKTSKKKFPCHGVIIFQAADIPISELQVEEMFSRLDKDGDGEVEFR